MMNQLPSMRYFNLRYAAVLYFALLAFGCSQNQDVTEPIDRYALVARHKIILNAPDTLGSLSVGNGEFAFTVDITGLQTFPKEYENGIPLGTQSQWGWHTFPQSRRFTLSDVAREYESCDGTLAPYAVQHKEGHAGDATAVLRSNPHRLHLGLVGLILIKSNGEEVQLSDLADIHQELDLWTGKIESNYTVEDSPVRVIVYSHPDDDGIAVKIESPLIARQRLRIKLDLPYGKDCHVCPGYDFDNPERHTSSIVKSNNSSALLRHTLDTTTYFINLDWEHAGEIQSGRPHHFELLPSKDNTGFHFTVTFKRDSTFHRRDFKSVEQSSIGHWKDFWTTGGVVDFSACSDPRANELERRVVLSQYLTRIQCAGSLPPQETGLTMNSWYGKFHLEMHWWHAVHFALWDRPHLLEKSMTWYQQALAPAKATAAWQGYAGARWQKMTDPQGRESPSNVGAFIIWQQPHPIYLAEELYRSNPVNATLKKYEDIVFSTAAFMASFVKRRDGQYHLCHPLIPAQEIFKATGTDDPGFELQYWYYGLATAQQWRTRLGMEEDEHWNVILKDLAPLAIRGERYLPNATTLDAYHDDQYRRDHPAITAAFGVLPYNHRIDTTIMSN
ncbi:MAG TPA: hypothetical protein VD816_03155, partial [Ohtaekwangia sp.]|nr:hypothetical protein [Ohtaekwangia sp.]